MKTTGIVISIIAILLGSSFHSSFAQAGDVGVVIVVPTPNIIRPNDPEETPAQAATQEPTAEPTQNSNPSTNPTTQPVASSNPQTPAPTLTPISTTTVRPSASPAATLESSASAKPVQSPTPSPTLTPDEIQIASAAGGLVEQSTPAPTPSATASPMAIPEVISQVKNILQPSTQKKALEEVKKSMNSVINAPAETITRSLNINPYDEKTLSYNTTVSLITFAIGAMVFGLALVKPNIFNIFRLRQQKRAEINKGIQTSI